MYKHSTTHRTLSRRLAALLAALALLAAMTLPVYAETQNEDTTKIAETVETVDETETTDDTTASTDSDDPADPTDDSTTAADDATDDTTPSADDTNTTPAGETTTDDTLDTSDEDTNNDGADGANIENTGTADDAVAQPDNEVEDEVRVQEAAAEEVTIYFLAPSGFDTTATVKFHARIQGEQDNDNWYTAQMTDSGKVDWNGRKIFFTTVYPGKSPSCLHSGYSRIEFITSTANGDELANYWGLGQNSLEWTSVYTYADQIYDADAGTWTAYTPFDPNNHQTFAGKTMLFQNQSDRELTDVKAIFYENDQEVATIDLGALGAIAVGKRVSFKIPEKDCTYIRFIVDGEETSLYNFYDQQDEGANNRHFLYDSGTACYVYRGNDNDSSWTIPQGTITVYFDATFSSAYTEYNGAALSIPNGESKDVYCCFKNDSEGTTSNAQKMTSLGNNLYSVEVPGGYSKIMFSGDSQRTSPANSGASTDWVPIDWSLDKPCYVADTNDAVVYKSGASRGGYWTEKDDVRDAEAGKGTTVVDIDKTTSFVRNSATKYVTTTLYDYYTDWELNGNNRDDYDKNFEKNHRSWVPFRQFDLALSDYYKTSGESSNVPDAVKYPIYTGHFQPSEYNYYNFLDLYNQLQMNLFGFGEGEGRKFMVDNNSSLCTKDNEKNHGNLTVQGIVADDATNTSKDGLPVMRGTENSSKPLVEPHFNTEFLLGTNSKHTKLGEVYKNVAFPFTQNDVFGDGIKYWSFDAAETTLYLKQDKDDDSYFLQSSTNKKASKNRGADSTEKGETGFFPFNETVKDGASANNYNYGFGARLQFDFTLTDDGKVVGTKGKTPIKFFFSGDDDVWVFIDGKLALDVGGAHAKASGLLVFSADDSSEYATAYVSGVKAGGTSEEDVRTGSKLKVKYKPSENASEIPIEFNYKGKTIDLKKGTTHTLTMYYMERGMWESNMAVAFNFPDHNELEVEKQVNVDNVDGLFKPFFENVDSFDFTIKNLATHYGTKSASTLAETKKLKVTKDKWEANPAGQNVCTWDTAAFSGIDAIHWYADMKDEGSIYRERRYGVIKPSSGQANISEMSYLSFEVYADTLDDTYLNLNDLYLELVDSNDKRKGSLGISGLAGKTYNGVSKLKANDWITIKLDLSKLTGDQDFNMTQLQTILIGDNYPVDLYIRNIQFTSKAAASTLVGFTTAQKDIPDYDTAIGNTTNEMKPAKGAQYTSSLGGSTQVVGEDGSFQLKNKETVTFKDQFRRGSYISVTEDADPDLYETTWTIYENGQAVTNNNGGNTVRAGTLPLSNVKDYAPDDGRTEKTSTDIGLKDDQSNNSYNGKKPDGKAIVFRSYTNPDAGEAAELTKLKLQFVNKVKTGSITIKKLGDSTVPSGTFTFKVTYTNVGGQNLEGNEKVEGTYTVDVGDSKALTINGIPIGTQFTIEEVPDAQGKTHLLSVAVENGDPAHVVDGKTVKGTVTKTDSASVTATFTNTLHDLMDIDLVKNWKNADGSDMTVDELKKMPDIIYVKLQRRVKAEPANKWVDVEYPSGSTLGYVAVKRGYTGWKCKFANLDATAWNLNETPEYEYRVVEGTLETKDGSTTFNPVGDDGILIIKGNAYEANSTTAEKGKATITLTNTQLNPKFNLDILKKSADESDKPLAGVEFTLEKLMADGKTVDENFTARIGITNAQGEVKEKGSNGNATGKDIFHNLEAGAYRLTETKAAAGYNLLSAPILVTFTKAGTCTLNGSTIEVSTKENKPTEFTKNEDGSYTLALTVLNRKTPALPHTGADAPSLWLLIGLPLAVAGLLILVFRYNKKGGRTR
ncbi:MAG: SpaA isopeptide-forming pilin-related protein [Eubacteriales bacterium]|nr:SpaA isopeptide-forming pilin-related protein [Eubacteriales bacterium]